jgi:CYTH domain-containing protein
MEIERKFLIKNQKEFVHNTLTLYPCDLYVQGYIFNSQNKTVRIRLIEGKECFITIKSGGIISRHEFEYSIPEEDGKQMIDLFCDKVIKKLRTKIPKGKHNWEIDVFLGDNEGLVVAEIELNSIDEEFEKPEWIGEEVTEDSRYLNSNLINKPYNSW